MRILIVNGFQSQQNEHFKCYVQVIQDTFQKEKFIAIEEHQFIIRQKNDLLDYLYEGPNTVYSNLLAMKNFNRLDMVFIIGESKHLPWYKSLEQVRFIFKMCKRTNKCMFACGIGFSMQIYFCATAMAEIQVVNGNEKGGPISQISKIKYEFSKFRENVVLDSLTGDYYTYNIEQQKWLPQGNVGMHYSRAVESIDNIEQEYLKKKQVYKTQESKYSVGLYISKITESKCCVKKQFGTHWLFEKVQSQFLCENKFSWDTHPVNITNVAAVHQNYSVLAESEKGPVIIEHLNTVAVQFYISKTYPESVGILQNFIRKKNKDIQSHGHGRIDISLEQAAQQQKILQFHNARLTNDALEHAMKLHIDSMVDPFSGDRKAADDSEKNQKRCKTAQSSRQFQLAFTTEFKHSGYNISKRRNFLVVDNNAVCQDPIIPPKSQIKTMKALAKKESKHFGTVIFDPQESIFKANKNPNIKIQDQQNSANKSESQQKSIMKQYKSYSNLLNNQQQPNSENYSPSANNFHQTLDPNNQNDYFFHTEEPTVNDTQKLTDWELDALYRKKLKNDLKSVWKNRKQIRETLHPQLDKDHMPKNPNNPLKMFLTRNNSSGIVKLQETNKPFNRFHEFQQMPQFNFDIPIIRNSSPYNSEFQNQLREAVESKRNWVQPNKEFIAYFSKATVNNTGYIQNYVARDPSQSPLLHKFRLENKDKWVNGAFKRF